MVEIVKSTGLQVVDSLKCEKINDKVIRINQSKDSNFRYIKKANFEPQKIHHWDAFSKRGRKSIQLD